jgi:hypothetical protein
MVFRGRADISSRSRWSSRNTVRETAMPVFDVRKVLRRTREIHALKFVPSWNEAKARSDLEIVSCTRSSASAWLRQTRKHGYRATAGAEARVARKLNWARGTAPFDVPRSSRHGAPPEVWSRRFVCSVDRLERKPNSRRFIQLMICAPTVNKRGASQFQTVWVIHNQWSLK